MRILIGADMVPTESNFKEFEQALAEQLVGEEIVELFENSDFRIVNLEMPLVDSLSPIKKCGPNLAAPTSSINLYKRMKINLVTLANNHIMDQGVAGLHATMNTLHENGIDYFGAGNSLSEAKKTFIVKDKKSGKNVGFYTCTEHEFSQASESQPGANPFDVFESFDHVTELKKSCDAVIVLYHGGKEYYRYPSPLLQKTCRKFVEKGADVVLCQHSHCIGCEERYNDKIILYGQGNFVFDKRDNEFWNSGMLVQLDIDHTITISYIPFIKANHKIRVAHGAEKQDLLLQFNSRTEEIKSENAVKDLYKKFSIDYVGHYLDILSGNKYSFFTYKLLHRIGREKTFWAIMRKLYTEDILLAVINSIECEAHRELLLNGLHELHEKLREREQW